jgi:hypothetical protein
MGDQVTSGLPDGADAPTVLVQPTTVEIDGCDGAFVSSGCGPDAIQPSATATPDMAADVVKDFTRTAAAPAMVPAYPGRIDVAFLEDDGPRPLSSPRHSCGSPHVDGLLSGSPGDGDGTVCSVQSFIEAFKRSLL